MAAKILVVDDDPNVQRLLQLHAQAGGLRGPRRGRRRGGLQAVGHGDARPDPARRHAAQARRLPGRRRRSGPRRAPAPRPDHHAHRRARGRAEGPRPARRRRRLPDQAVPPGRAAGPDQEPARPLRAAARRSSGRPPLGRVLAFYGAKGGVGTTTIAINAAIALHRELGRKVVPRRRQPPVRRPPRLPRPRARPQEHRRRRDAPRRSTPTSIKSGPGQARLRASTCCSRRRRPRPPSSSRPDAPAR